MTGDVLVDTNVLVYTFDRNTPAKQERALATLQHLVERGRGKLAAQVLGEFFLVVTARLRPPVPVSHALAELAAFTRTWPVLPLTPLIVLHTARAVAEYRLSYYDAQIWATARLNRIDVVLSEDFQDGQTLEGVIFRNPFNRAFTI